MTIKDLKKYKYIKAEIIVLDKQIADAYKPLRSPALGKNDTGKLSAFIPGNPTEAALKNVERLRLRREKLEEKLQEIETWLETIEDHYMAAVCRIHYINGTTWNDTAFLIYKHYNGDTVRKAVQRYFDTDKV